MFDAVSCMSARLLLLLVDGLAEEPEPRGEVMHGLGVAEEHVTAIHELVGKTVKQALLFLAQMMLELLQTPRMF